MALTGLRSQMSYLCQKCQKTGVADFDSEIKSVDNYPDLEKLAL